MNKSIYTNRINELRKLMQQDGVSLYIVSNNDFHLSEMPADYFKEIEFLTGFTGSEANLVITETNAHLWTDGRFTIQGKDELERTGIILHIHSDESDEISTLEKFFAAAGDTIFDDATYEDGSIDAAAGDNPYYIAFDGRLMKYSMLENILAAFGNVYHAGLIRFYADINYVDEIWHDRPLLPSGRIRLLAEDVAGTTIGENLEYIRRHIDLFGADAMMVFTALDDIAALYCFRGTDYMESLTSLSYACVDRENAYLFIDGEKLRSDDRAYFRDNGVTVLDYDEFYSFLDETETEVVVLDADDVNAAVYLTLENNESVRMFNAPSLVAYDKAEKNERQIENIRYAHRKDGVAMVRFIKWIKENVGKVYIDEYSAGEYLELLRKEQGAISLSFATICGYAANGAIVHYEARRDTCLEIKPEGLLLVDSGGQYLGGTTDVTRTIPVGPISDEMRRNYTIVLMAMLELSNARFRYGVNDVQLDLIARNVVWSHGIDYDHGTGHGVGYMLNVHEGPHSISWRKRNYVRMTQGMIVTDEPGYYKEGEYGIRHECELLTIADPDDNRFLRFENITRVPIDTSAIEKSLMTESQIKTLNAYNQCVYDDLEALLTDEERAWLYKETRPI